MFGKMQASGLTEFILFIITSAIWGQSCFLVHLVLAFPQLLSYHRVFVGVGGVVVVVVVVVMTSSGSPFGEPSFTPGQQKSLMAVTFHVY